MQIEGDMVDALNNWYLFCTSMIFHFVMFGGQLNEEMSFIV